MKKNIVQRSLALLLCMAMVIGVVPAGIMAGLLQVNAVPIIQQDTNELTNLVQNGTFDNDMEGWGGYANAPSSTTVVDGAVSIVANSGSVCLKQSITVAANDVLELSMKYKYVSGSSKPYVGLWLYDGVADNAHYVGTKVINIEDKTGQWVDVTFTATIPEGVSLAVLELGNNSGATVSYLIDDVTLVNYNEDYALYENFENFNFNAQGTPNYGQGPIGWTASNNFSSSAVHLYGFYYQNSYSLFFQTDNTWAKSRSFDVVAGSEYTASFVTQRQGNAVPSGYAKIVFLNEAGQAVGEERADIGKGAKYNGDAQGNWAEESIVAVAPAGAVKAYIEFGREASGGTFGLDKLTVTKEAGSGNPGGDATDPTDPSEPEDTINLVLNGTFDANAENWGVQVNSPSTFEVADGAASAVAAGGSICLKQHFDAEAGDTYLLKLKYKWISGDAKPYVGLWFFHDTNNNADWVNTVKVDVADKTGNWVEVAVSATVPDGADIVEVQIGNNSGATVSYQIDDVSLINLSDAYVLYEQFEGISSSNPAGWTASNNFSGSAVQTYGGYYNNSSSLFFQSANVWAKSPEFAVVSGKEYTADFVTQRHGSTVPSGYAKIVFLDAAGQSIGEEKADVGTGNKLVSGQPLENWKEESVAAVAPAGAVEAYIEFGREASGGTFGIDNLTVTESGAPVIPGPDPTDPTDSTEASDPTDPTDSTEPSEPDPVIPGDMVQNGTFDNGTEYWGTYVNDPSTITVADGVASFVANGGGLTMKQAFDVKKYDVLELKLKYKWISGDSKPFVGLWFFYGTNSNSNWVATTKVDVADQSGEWIDIVINAIVPAGADIAEIQIGNNSKNTVSYQIDDVTLTRAEMGYVFVEEFEDLAKSGWTASNDFSGSAVQTYSNYYQKTKSLFFQADNTWAKSPEFDVKAGHAYTVEYFAKKMANNMHKTGYMQIVFLDANGAELRTKRITAGTMQADWAREGTVAIAPEGSVKAYLLFGCETQTGTYGIDHITVTESAEIADPSIEDTKIPSGLPDPSKLQNTDFEEGLKNWNGYSNPGATTTVVTEGAYKGQSLLFTAAATEKEKASNCRYQIIELTGATALELTAWSKRVSGDGSAYMGLWFYDADGKLVPDNTAYTVEIAKTTDWAEYKLIQEVPQGAVTVKVEFGNNSGYVIDYMVDDVNIAPYTGPADQINPAIKPGSGSNKKYPAVIVDANKLNGSLEEIDADGDPVGWRMVGVPEYTMIKADDAPHGNYYIQMAKKEKGGNSLHSPRIACIPGETYELKVMARDIEGTCRIGLYVYDADGNRIDEACKVVLTDGSGVWKMYLIQQAMPDNAAGIELEVWGVSNTIFTVQIDALAIGVSEEKVKPPYTPTPYTYPTVDELLENVTDVYPRVYFTPEEAKQIKLRRFNTLKTKYGWSWSKMYSGLLEQANGYLEVEEVKVGMNTGKSVIMNIWEDPNSQHNRDNYLANSYDENGELYEYPYTGFGALLPQKLADMMKAWSLAYIMTGKTVYSDQAIKMAVNVASWEWWIDKNWTDKKKIDADAGIAWMMEGMVAVYDMCYNEMTPEQRKAVERSIIEKGLVPLSKQIDPNSTVNGNMMMVGGILSGAAVILNENNAEEIYPYLCKALLAMHNALDNYAYSGDTEGHYYTDFGLETFIPGVGHIYRATKMDGIIDHYFFTDILPHWAIMWAANVTGTHPNYSDGSINAYLKLPMAVLSSLTKDPVIDGFLVNAGGTGDTFNNLVYLNGDPKPEYLSDYAAVIEEFGYGALRTGFADDDMLLTLKANDSQMGHNHYDQNSILLAVGPSWLINDPGSGSYYLQDRTFWTHNGHSTILVDGNSQLVLGTASTRLVFNNNLYSYIVGSAPRAYGSDFDSRILDKFDRHAIQVNHEDKGYYVIIDDLASSKNRVYTWQMYNGTRQLFSVDDVEVPEETLVMGNKVSMPLGKNVLNLNFIDGEKLEIGDKVYTSNGNPVGTTLVANSAASKTHQFMTVISTDANSLSNYISFYDILAGARSTVPEKIAEGEISWDSSMPIGQEIVKPNMVGTDPCVFFRGNKVGDWIEFPFTVEDDGVYDVNLVMGVSDGCCQVKATLDGEIASEPFDCSGLPEEMIDISFGELNLTKGTHTFKIEVVGPGLDEDYEPGWFLINAGGVDMMRTDIDVPESTDLTVTEVIDTDEVLGGMINYKDNKYDFLMFNRTEGAVTAGALNTDGQQASVLGLVDGKVTEGFAATGATTMTYDGKVMFVAEKKVDIVASNTGWQVTAYEAQTVQLTAIAPELDYVVTVNGETVDSKIENGILTVALAEGENVIVVDVDEPKPTEPTKPSEPATEPTEPVVTDREDNTTLWIIVASATVLLAGAATGIVLFIKKRRVV